MNIIPEAKRLQTINQICQDVRIQRRVVGRLRKHIAKDLVNFAADRYERGTVDLEVLKQDTKQEMREGYGSILAMILFTVIWEIIKQWLFD